MGKRVDAIYARQSIHKKDSISIESQIEFCRYELKGETCREYTDRGYSGRNTDRPMYQELVRDIRQGRIRRVVVYRLDRISRSILDFANMMEMFREYDVELISSTEKFDTSTPMGRAMLNICIVFAQLERETIRERVTDSWYSRSQKGLFMGGKIPYGYRTEPYLVDGIHTKRLIPDPVEEAHVRQMYEMYAQPEVSCGEIVRYFAKEKIKDLSRPALTALLSNPIYVRADREVYDFFLGQDTEIVNTPAEFDGIRGCYLYRNRGGKSENEREMQENILVLAPGEGIVDSGLWLACRRKMLANPSGQGGRRPVHTWLAGKIKCGRCGKALKVDKGGSRWYFRCSKRADNKSCEGAGTLRVEEVEDYVYRKMRQKAKGTLWQEQMSGWRKMSFDERREMADRMLVSVHAVEGKIAIEWRKERTIQDELECG